MYTVVEIYERDLASIATFPTYEEAAAAANRLLKQHCGQIGYADEYEELIRDMDEDPEANQVAEDIHVIDVARHETNAWCNLGHGNWDAHVHGVEVQS